MKTLYQAYYRGKVLHPLSHEVCAIYDPRSGRIVHVHEAMRWPGSSDSGRKDFEARSLEMAAKHGHEVSKLKTILLDPATLDATKRYKLDPKSLRLIEIASIVPLGRLPKKQVPASKKRAASTRQKTRSAKSAKPKR